MRLVITRLELDKFVSNMLNMSGHSGVMSAPHTTQDMTVHQMDLVCLLGYVLGFYECAMCWVSMNIKISEYSDSSCSVNFNLQLVFSGTNESPCIHFPPLQTLEALHTPHTAATCRESLCR